MSPDRHDSKWNSAPTMDANRSELGDTLVQRNKMFTGCYWLLFLFFQCLRNMRVLIHWQIFSEIHCLWSLNLAMK